MSNNTIILLVVGFVVAVGLWVYGHRVGFRSGENSQKPTITLLRRKIETLTDENFRLQSESREVADKRGENERKSGELDGRERQISKMEQRQRDADRDLKSRARKLREESEEMEKREEERVRELENEQRKARRAEGRADGVKKYYLQAARSAVPAYIGDAALERKCAGVYVVSRMGAVKIGMTDDFSRRFKELDAKCREVGIIDLRSEALVPMDEGRRQVEERVHNRFEDKRTDREWFAVSPDEAVQQVIDQAWLVKTDNARYRELRHIGFAGSKCANTLPVLLRKFSGVTPLHLAAAENDVPAIARLMVSPFFVNKIRIEDSDGRTPMDWAVGCNAADAIVEIAKRDDDYVKLPLLGGNRLMRLAAVKGAHESISVLAELGLKADARRDSDSITPMHLAANAESVTMLVGLGANVNTADKDGNTPLHYARNPGVVDALVKNNANIHAKNNEGETSLGATIVLHSRNVENDRLDKSDSRKIVVSLMEHGANVAKLAENSPNIIGGTTLMHYAAGWDDVGLIEKLTAHDKAFVKSKDKNDNTPLHWAAQWGSGKAIAELVKHGAFVYATNCNGEAPLHLAAAGDCYWAVKALLAADSSDAHVNVDIYSNAYGKTPLDYWAENFFLMPADEAREIDIDYDVEEHATANLLHEHGGKRVAGEGEY